MVRLTLELLAGLSIGAGLVLPFGTGLWPFVGATVGVSLVAALHAIRINRLLQWLASDPLVPAQSPRLLGVWGEVTERCVRLVKRFEKQTRQSDARLADFLAAIQASPNGVMLLDSDGRIEWVNLTAASLLHLDPLRDVGQYVRNLVRVPAFARYWNEGDFGREVQFDGTTSPTGTPLHLSVQLHPYGKAKRLLLVRDITNLHRAEVMRRDFVANVSHEIRTPLTVLSGFVETLQTLPLQDEEKTRYLELMAQQAKRMQVLVVDLLMLSRLEASPDVGAGQWVVVNDLTEKVVQEARGLSQALKERPQTLQVRFQCTLELAGMPSEIYSALSNLLSNAVRYTPAGGVITLEWSLNQQGDAVAAVSDSGPGIGQEHLSRLTERFYRVDESRSQETGGTGLGLSIVKHVMARHGGTLQIQSAIGQGSTFSLVFPKARVRSC